MKSSVGLLIAALIGLVFFGSKLAQASTHEFYKGKTIRFVVGFGAGGGYDLAARAVARHMGKYIPGTPTIAVENMGGAGSLIEIGRASCRERV